MICCFGGSLHIIVLYPTFFFKFTMRKVKIRSKCAGQVAQWCLCLINALLKTVSSSRG